MPQEITTKNKINFNDNYVPSPELIEGEKELMSIKAGLMEIADIFVINKADKEGADATFFELNLMLDLEKEKWEKRGWRPPIVETVAVTMRGIKELWEEIKKHRKFLEESGEIERKRKFRAEEEVKTIVSDSVARKISERLGDKELSKLIDKIVKREIDPYSAAEVVLKETLGVKI